MTTSNDPEFSIYTQTGDEMSSNWGGGKKFVADAWSREEARQILIDERNRNPMDAFHCEDQDGTTFVLTKSHELVQFDDVVAMAG